MLIGEGWLEHWQMEAGQNWLNQGTPEITAKAWRLLWIVRGSLSPQELEWAVPAASFPLPFLWLCHPTHSFPVHWFFSSSFPTGKKWPLLCVWEISSLWGELLSLKYNKLPSHIHDLRNFFRLQITTSASLWLHIPGMLLVCKCPCKRDWSILRDC